MPTNTQLFGRVHTALQANVTRSILNREPRPVVIDHYIKIIANLFPHTATKAELARSINSSYKILNEATDEECYIVILSRMDAVFHISTIEYLAGTLASQLCLLAKGRLSEQELIDRLFKQWDANVANA